jgi:hypothetical protein
VVAASKSGAVSPILIDCPPLLFALETIHSNRGAKVNIGMSLPGALRAYHLKLDPELQGYFQPDPIE